jgi:uncharacterized protein
VPRVEGTLPGPPPGFRCIDVHVHLHPERLAGAIERVFAQEGWRPAHPFEPRAVAATLRAHGVEAFCFFSYAHKPGMAPALNRWIAATAAGLPEAVALGTVHAEDDVAAVVGEALDDLGLAGFKLHCSVQRFPPDDPRLVPLYERAEAEGRPLVLHAGTAPYRDPHTGAAPFARLMARFPRLRIAVAHMGAYETDAFLALTEAFPHVYLDTAMAMTPRAHRYVGIQPVATERLLRHQDRILFGSDFPVIPYDYDEERRWAWERGLPPDALRRIFHDNAVAFLGLERCRTCASSA